MKGIALLLLCAVALAHADLPLRTRSGNICHCNPIEAVSVCAQNGSDDELIVHENCNQFYKCFNGEAIPFFCSSNLLYNPLAEICDWPANVDCGSRPIVEAGGSDCQGEIEDDPGNDVTDNGGTDGGNGGNCNCDPNEAPSICAADSSDGVLIAHQNCNQFYKCANGVPVALNCYGQLLYNPYTEQCDWPQNVDCGDRPIVEIEGGNNGNGDTDCEDSGNGNENDSGNGNGDNGGSGTCNCNPGEAPAICAADGSDGTLIAHENCNQFYKCANGVPVALNCYGQLLYNPYTQHCDWPQNVNCGDRPIVEIEGGNNGNGDTDCEDSGNGNENDNGNGDNGGSGTCNCNPGEAPGICATDGSDGTLIAHENCNQFYKCANGVPVALNCYDQLLYNPYTQQCDWPQNVNCGDRPIVEIEGGNNGNGDTDCEDSGNGNENDSSNGNGDNGGSGTCNCNPGEAPAICAADGSDGTLIAHENCNQFYKCANGVPVTLNCYDQLLYNPYTQQCDWPQNVNCGDRPIVEIEGGNNGNGDTDCEDSGNGNENDNGNGDNGGSGTCNCNPGEAPGICATDGSDGTLIAHENCNQFYKCANGVPVALNCYGQLLYNPYTEQCDWPQNVDCGDRPIVEIEGGNNGNGDTDCEDSGNGSENDNGNGDNGGSGTCNCNPGEAPGICATDGSDGTLIAHENCNQFYKCAHGVPVAFSCHGQLLYNPYTQQCDWPQNVECGDRPIVEIEGGNNGNGDNGSGDSGNGNGNGDNGGSGTCNCNPGEAPGICATDGSDGTLIAHENCNQFYKCAHGVPVAFSCHGQLLYNPYTQQCDWPHNVDCGDRPIVEIEGGNNGNGDNGSGDSGNGNENDNGNGNGDNGGSGTCNCNPGEAPGICATDGSDGTLIAHENCNQFYKCAHGVPVAFSCHGQLLYNPYTQQCDWPQNVDCGDRPIVEIEGGNNGNGDNGSGDSGNGDTDCGESGNGNENDNGNGDNGGSGTCNCNPGEAPGICATDGSDGTLIAHENCNQFYKCANGVPVALNCYGQLLFNPYTQQCDWPQNVECGDRPIVEIEGGNNGNGDNGSGDSGNGNENDDNGGSGTCNCNPGEAPAICAADGSDGTLIAHENCNQFYKCANGVPVALNCYGQLLFNPYTQQCDWPQNVNCGDRPIVEIEGGNNGNGDTDCEDSETGNENDNGNGDNGSSGTCNCNPGEAPGICATDGSDGTLIAHENCNQFYKCANGIPVALNCYGQLLYNPYTQRCDWPQNVECGDRPIVEIEEGGNDGSEDTGNGDSDVDCEDSSDGNGNGDNGGSGTCNCNPGEAPSICGTDGSEGTLIAHENCNQFYKCANGVPIALNCYGQLLYNPYAQQCDWPQNVDCGDRPIVEIEEGSNGNGDNGSGDSGSGNDNGDADSNCDPAEAPAICATGNSEGLLIAHETCNKYYKCSFGIPVAMNCYGDLLYNPALKACDWPHNVDCGDRVIVEMDEESGIDGESIEGDNNENTVINPNTDPSEAPAICAGTGSDGVLVAHEKCDQFYVCSSGSPVTLECPASTLYNPSIEDCDWPVNVECGDRIVPEPEVEDGGPCLCSSRQAPGICAGSDSDGKLIAHENCSQYYVCFNGKPIARSCPTSLFYEPHTKQCTWLAAVECDGRDVTTNFSLNKHMQARRSIS